MNAPAFPSGIVKACNYFKSDQHLDITTLDGFVFRYYNVPEEISDAFIKAENPGLFYMKMIRNKYKRLLRSFDS